MMVIDTIIDQKIKETTQLLDSLITQRRQSRFGNTSPETPGIS